MKRNDLTGMKFSRITVLNYSKTIKGATYWECKCHCGSIWLVKGTNLVTGNTKSCGCLNDEKISNLNKTHGMSRTHSEFMIWAGLIGRCTNKNNPKYKNYGGRGIVVCDRWINSFENFYSDMGRRPSKKHSVDRINNDGNYEPTNCRWALPLQQARNKQKTKYVWYKGSLRILREVCQELGIRFQKVRGRKNYRGISFQESFDTYVIQKSNFIIHSFGYIN